MITSGTPTDWRDLQEQGAENSARVRFHGRGGENGSRGARRHRDRRYGEETVKGRKCVLLCESKHWAARVPQQTIHAFGTTIADVGVNAGYKIASSGFQSGAFAASELTNLELVTCEGFQAKFEDSWLGCFLHKCLQPSPVPDATASGALRRQAGIPGSAPCRRAGRDRVPGAAWRSGAARRRREGRVPRDSRSPRVVHARAGLP